MRFAHRITVSLFATFAATATPSSLALDLPSYDPDAACDQRTAVMSSAERPAARHVCIVDEQEAYEQLRQEWPVATDRQQREAKSLRAGPIPTYAALATYLRFVMQRDENSLRLQEQQRPNHFRRD